MKKIPIEKAPPRFELPTALVLSVICVAVLVFYGRSFDNPIFFDTFGSFTRLHLLEDTLKGFSLLGLRSLGWVTFGIFYRFVGDDWYWHNVFNVVIHSGNSILVFFFLRKLFRLAQAESSNLAFYAALLFALHPVAIYAPAYLIQRTILVATFFGLIMLLCYLKGILEKKPSWLFWALVSYFLSIHGKESSIMLLAVALALTRFSPDLSWRIFFKRHSWFFVLGALIALELMLRYTGIFGQVYEPHAQEMDIPLQGTWGLSVITQATLFFRYLFLWVFPYVNWIYIDIGLPFAHSFLSWNSLGALSFLAYGGLAFWLLFKKEKTVALLGLGLIYPWILFATEFSTVRFWEEFVLYRSYLWMTGLYAVLPFFLSLTVFGKKMVAGKEFFLALYLGFIIAVGVNRLMTFDTTTLLWQDAVTKAEANHGADFFKTYRAYSNLAVSQTIDGNIEAALANYRKSIKLHPNHVHALNSLASVLMLLGNYEEAHTHLKHALEVNPKFIDAWLGMGFYYEHQALYAEAQASYQKALDIEPHYPAALYNMGNIFYRQGDFAKTVELYSAAIQYKPNYIEAHHALAKAYLQQGRIPEAKKELETVLNLDAGHKGARHLLESLDK